MRLNQIAIPPSGAGQTGLQISTARGTGRLLHRTEDMMTATAPNTNTARDQFLATFAREHATTMRVLRAYPEGKETLRPHEKCKDAVNLAWIFVGEMGMLLTALTTGFDWSKPPQMPATPSTMNEVIMALDALQKNVVQTVSGMSDSQLATERVHFPSGPGEMGTPTKMEFLWFVLSDQIHHRGQFSIYLRIAGGKVPSIYGPTADEPWM
jgi:uncharacterized damage-inducible protein DinB